ncbi:MAG: diguanylate cyclase [Alphaproteobacteria bacterium]
MASPNPTVADISPTLAHGERAMAMMKQLSVAPTPKHFAIFFAAASAQQPELVKEIEHFVQSKRPFSEEMLDQLYNSYLAELPSRAVQEAASSTRKILAEMMQTVADVAGTSHSVSKEIGMQLAQVGDGEMSERTLRAMAQTVIDSAHAIKESSDAATQKLAGAQQEVAALRENLAKATSESERDFLTGCHNRKAFDKRLIEAMREANEKESALTLLMLDIDHFKRFNDNYGHLIGDEVLKIVARTLTDSVKGMDTVARYGGEEFVVILPRTPVGGGMIVAEQVRKSIAGKELKRRGTGELYGIITVSVGVAAFRHGQDTPQSLTKRADEALYRSKKGGRNRVTQENLAE